MKTTRFTLRGVQVIQRGPARDGAYSFAIPSLNIVCIGWSKEEARSNAMRYIERPYLLNFFKTSRKVYQIAGGLR